jgi:tRNA dimethylallyltransferase
MPKAGPTLNILAGVTAAGKTSLALEWATQNNAEIISCDAVSVYKGMDIGSAKPTIKEREWVPHHGIDLFEINETSDVLKYYSFTRQKVQEILQRGKSILVVGGSGFYLHSFFAPVVDGVEIPDEVRRRVDMWYAEGGLEEILGRLEKLNPDGTGDLDRHNPRRVVRALERCLASGKTLSALKFEFDQLPKPFSDLPKRVIWLDRENQDLENRISIRTQKMLDHGLLQEIRDLIDAGILKNESASSSIGYREGIACVMGDIPRDEIKARIDSATRKLVSKQRKWFRKHLDSRSRLVLQADDDIGANDLPWFDTVS